MAKSRNSNVRATYLKTFFYGVVSVGLYSIMLLNENTVRETWASGGVYAVLPIVTVFVFSFIHGSFANYLMTLLGIEAKKK